MMRIHSIRKLQLSDSLTHRLGRDVDQASETLLQLEDHSNRTCHGYCAERKGSH